MTKSEIMAQLDRLVDGYFEVNVDEGILDATDQASPMTTTADFIIATYHSVDAMTTLMFDNDPQATIDSVTSDFMMKYVPRIDPSLR
jgi:hypothetical protein